MSGLHALANALFHATWQLALLGLVYATARLGLTNPRQRYAAAMVTLALQVLAPSMTLGQQLLAARVAQAPFEVAARPEFAWEVWVVAAWCLGALIASLRLTGGLFVVRRWVRSAVPVDPSIGLRLKALADDWGVQVQFVATARQAVPMTVGFLRPVVLLPAALLTALPMASLELLVAHELAHVRRWDYLANVLQRAAEALLFFHPAVWWVSAAARDERELCCDDLVTQRTGAPMAYAEALLALEENRSSTAGLALASHGGRFMSRVKRLVEPQPRAFQPIWGGALVTLLFTALAVTLISGPVRAEGRALSIAWLPPVLESLRPDIERSAVQHGIDPDLLALFVLVESQGDAHARSASGARGLMQLLPKTAEVVAARAHEPFAAERLDEPAYNLELGAAYLAAQLSEFNGDPRQVELAAAAYNGGPKVAQAWRDGRSALTPETDRYRSLLAGLWSERKDPRSATWLRWRSALREAASAKSIAPLTEAKPTLAWGAQPNPFTGERYQHTGVDLAAAVGTTIVAPMDGVVDEVSTDVGKGTVLVLKHAGGLESRYHHLGALKVALNQRVTQGSPLAEVGLTGKTTGPHVHFEVRDLGEPIDPAPFLR